MLTSSLIRLSLDHYGDNRLDESAIGSILAENQDYILVEVITDIGQFSSYSIFNKKYITHVSEDNSTLRFMTFAKDYQITNENYDPHHLCQQIPKLSTSISDMIFPNTVITLDAYDYTSNNQGIVDKRDDAFVELKIFDENNQPFKLQKFAYKNLVSIDLVNYSDSLLNSSKHD